MIIFAHLMWTSLAYFILRHRISILIVLLLSTLFMGYYASKVKMSYEFTNAIPTDNPKYRAYQEFKAMFGEDGTMLAIGFDADSVFTPQFLQSMQAWEASLRKVNGVEHVLGITSAINLIKQENDSGARLASKAIFTAETLTKHPDSAIQEFLNLPFYNNLLYNPESNSVLTAVYINKDKLKSEARVGIVKKIQELSDAFAQQQKIQIHYSGLPFIRTLFAESVKFEMNLILLVSILLTALILYLFFRSFTAVFFSMLVVLAGVVWALGLLVLFGYKITLLSALIAPLIVVIGIPNCIYFLNKYHTQYNIYNDKEKALLEMVSRMGIVTLFTNLTAAIGFGVFYFTKSQILKEFGLVSGLSILLIFFISLFAIPAIFSFLAAPKKKHTRYLENKYLTRLLLKFEYWVFEHRTLIFSFWIVLLAVALVGMSRLKSVGHIVDDLPKQHSIYTDLKYFESKFKGVMPLEIVIDCKKKQGAVSLPTIKKLDEFSQALSQYPDIAKPLSLVEAVKFARQAYYDGDSTSYGVPNSFDVAFLLPYLRMKADSKKSQMSKLVSSFTDSTKRFARISASMKDVGSVRLAELLESINKQAVDIFDTGKYTIQYTGTSVVFLEGSKFIIKSLTDSLLLALVMIVLCMAFLFRSWRIVLISIVTNTIPLAITAGVMGLFQIPLKPSTVLVFSIALGIAIDVTIRFLVNYKQDLPTYHFRIKETVQGTIKETGISIIYTSLILAGGFIVFLVSQFDGTKALGFLTALTLLLAMITNLTLLPALLVWFDRTSTKNEPK